MQKSSSEPRLFRPEALKPPRQFIAPTLPEKQALWLEIGAGVGMHALACAAANPQVQLYAIERTAEKYHKFEQRFQAQPLPNLQPIHADAVPWLVHALPPACLERVFILYPNPEPKNAAQRWLNRPFFAFLLSRIRDHGQIQLASNIPAYIQEARTQADQHWQLQVEQRLVSGEGRTHFEVKYLARGEPCSELVLIKPAAYKTPFDEYVAGRV